MSLITLNEINSNPIYQPPKEWIDDIEKELKCDGKKWVKLKMISIVIILMFGVS